MALVYFLPSDKFESWAISQILGLYPTQMKSGTYPILSSDATFSE
jgi:hypothetical protein